MDATTRKDSHDTAGRRARLAAAFGFAGAAALAAGLILWALQGGQVFLDAAFAALAACF